MIYNLNKKGLASAGSRGRRNILSSQQVDQVQAYVWSSRKTKLITYHELATGEFSEWPVSGNQMMNALGHRRYTRRIALQKPALTVRHKLCRKLSAEDPLS